MKNKEKVLQLAAKINLDHFPVLDEGQTKTIKGGKGDKGGHGGHGDELLKGDDVSSGC